MAGDEYVMATSLVAVQRLLLGGLDNMVPHEPTEADKKRERMVREHIAKLDKLVAEGKTAGGVPWDYLRHRYVDERFNV